MDDYRKDPDYEVIHYRGICCDDCGGKIPEGEECYEIPAGRSYLILCPHCAKVWFEGFRSCV